MLDKIGAGFIGGETVPVDRGGNETVVEAGDGIEAIEGGACSGRSTRAMSTSSGSEAIVGCGSRVVLTRQWSTAPMVAAAIISIVSPIRGTGCPEGVGM